MYHSIGSLFCRLRNGGESHVSGGHGEREGPLVGMGNVDPLVGGPVEEAVWAAGDIGIGGDGHGVAGLRYCPKTRTRLIPCGFSIVLIELATQS